MDHERVSRALIGVVAGYLIALAVWLAWLAPHAPPGTLPYQVMIMVGLFGSACGIAMALASMPTRADRQLRRHGLEGWARIDGVHPLSRTDHASELTELDVELTVPGAASYHGTIVVDVMPVHKARMVVGETVPIRVDPLDRDRIILVL
ncbi:hypothetical protein AB0G00_20775 [Nocardia salmonicida]|uniref:hypothetical protein n=1 Tax=Nocardia TaxID=1817 RepID=UPI00265A73A7|nr:hypothetical protein [Nocardia sp. PE-7]WKG13440.1 hypothetical protein QX204_30710 [Nocardia sp. PE-7]